MKQYLNLFDFTQKSELQDRNLGLFNGRNDHDSRVTFLCYITGFPPLVGLYAAFIMGLVTAILR
jgi:SulP family sulfate permease